MAFTFGMGLLLSHASDGVIELRTEAVEMNYLRREPMAGAAQHFIEFGYYEGRTDLDVFA